MASSIANLSVPMMLGLVFMRLTACPAWVLINGARNASHCTLCSWRRRSSTFAI